MEWINTTNRPAPIWLLRGNPNTPQGSQSEKSIPSQKLPQTPLRYRCRQCHSAIAFIADEIPVDDLGSHSIQINPNGFVHEVITVRCTQNTLSVGTPVPADSWFPGFYWRYLICDGCTEFLGWSYSKPMETFMVFAGLSRAAITIDPS